MSETIDTLVRRLDSALSRIDAMGADALDARTEQHRLNTLLAASEKARREAEEDARTLAKVTQRRDLAWCMTPDEIESRDRSLARAGGGEVDPNG